MLNELVELSESMRIAGITATSWFSNYKKCPNYKTFFLFVDCDGLVVDLEPVANREQVVSFRKWEIPNQGISFPAFSVPPLFRARSKEARDCLAALRRKLKTANDISEETLAWDVDDLARLCEQNWTGAEVKRINKCIQSRSKDLAEVLGAVPDDFKAVDELILRAALLDAERLHKSILDTVIRRMMRSPRNAETWLDVLLVSAAKDMTQATLVPELANISCFKYPSAHQKVQEWINSRLMARDELGFDASARPRWDAFQQPLTDKDLNSKFPEVRLPVLGNIKLRSMNRESPCQTRYRHIDTTSFPAGSHIRQAMKDALEWLGDDSRRGMTWQDVSGTCGFTKRESKRVPVPAILLAYPLILRPDPPELTGLFAGDEDAKFEDCAERVVSALQRTVAEYPGTEVRVIVLAKADKARTKLIESKCYEARRLIEAARMWCTGCGNVPTIKLNMGTDKTPEWISPFIPFPAEVVKCLNRVWLQGGTRTDSVHGLSIGEGLGLLMEQESAHHPAAERALRLATSNASPLLLALGHGDHRRDSSFEWNKDTLKYAKHAGLLPSLLGLLLYKLGYTKGGYMQVSPFQVGRMLALADTLHKEYCQHVRKEGTPLPPQLMGNALMTTTLDNPTAGLARLSERIAPYQAWANTAKKEDGAGLAKWALQQFGQLANELGKQTLPETCSDADKAQMLLGYLARPERDASNS